MVRAIEKVSVEDVNRVAMKYLDPGWSIVTILTPESSGKPVGAESPRPGVESFAPHDAERPAKLPEWAAKALKRLDVRSLALVTQPSPCCPTGSNSSCSLKR